MKIKEKAKKLWKENKGIIILGAASVAFTVVTLVVNSNKDNYSFPEYPRIDESGQYNLIDEDQYSPVEGGEGRDILMTYTDKETGEVLWKELCSESYMESMKEDGMQYDTIRALNGIEEEA